MKKNQFLIPVKILLATTTVFVHSVTPVLASETLDIDTIEESEEMEPLEQAEELQIQEPEELETEIESTEEEVEIVEEVEVIEEETVEVIPEEVVEEPAAEVAEEPVEVVEDEFADLPRYDQIDTYDLAMQIMEADLQAKNQTSKARTMSLMSTGIPHVDRFLDMIIPYAIEDSVTSGILPSITIAQGALESAWGLSGLALNANNLFGIKASADWKGPIYRVVTSEWKEDPVYDKDGKLISEGYFYEIVDNFRKYDTWLGSIRDHGDFFTSTEWRKNNYRHVVGEKDYKKAAQALSDAGYATDPGYANKLISIIDNYQLYKYDQVPVLSADYHVQKHGWLNKVGSHLSLGHAGDDLRVEDLRFNFIDNPNVSIDFSAHIQKLGWVNNIKEGQNAGNVGNSYRMEAIKMNLTGEGAKSYDIYYRVYSDSLGWSGWAKNGEAAGTEGYAKKIRSIEVIISWKDEVPVDTSGNSFRTYVDPVVNYTSQLQYDGWTSWVKNGQMTGTMGKGRRLEALQMYLSSLPYEGGIEYQSHAQTHGWLPVGSNGETSGTVGQGKRLEAIKINLTGQMAQEFDIYYRTHIQTYGWTGWAKNGAPSGSEGLARRMEAVEIRLVKKGDKAPGSTNNSFYK